MSTVAPTIGKNGRKYKKPRILCPNGCGQMVAECMNGTPHGHRTLHGKICGKADNGTMNSDASDVKTQKCEAADVADDTSDDTAVKTVPSSPAPKRNAVIDAKTAHPKMKLKQLMMIDVVLPSREF